MVKIDGNEHHHHKHLRSSSFSCRGKTLMSFTLVTILISQGFRYGVQPVSKLSQNPDRNELRILSMGGSVTLGSQLDSKTDSYPYRIKPGSFVTNIALPASGSEYPSLCISSMVDDDLQRQGVKEIEGFTFDIITMEYSLNGIAGFDLLLRRLRKRYPNAVFIYVHLLSPRMGLRDKKTGKMPREILSDTSLKFSQMNALATEALADSDAEWTWDMEELINSRRMESFALEKMSELDGAVWSFPITNAINEIFSLFTADRHHLNYEGHSLVAAGIRNILNQRKFSRKIASVKRKHATVGSWGKGDFCYIWFNTGLSPLHHTGGIMKLFIKPNKFAHHMSIGNGTSTISVFNKMPWPMPLSVMHMVWHPQYYPRANITITSHGQGGREIISDPFILHPVHPSEEMRSWHVTLTTNVGVANPGPNTVSFDCLEKCVKPLRVVGIVMCGACDEMTL